MHCNKKKNFNKKKLSYDPKICKRYKKNWSCFVDLRDNNIVHRQVDI